MLVRQLFDDKLAQYSYFVGCPATGTAIVFDPERDVDRYFELAEKNGLRLVAAADTHIHADYISGLRELAERGIKVYASDEGTEDWKYEWLIGSAYEYQLLKHGDRFTVGNIVFETVHTPGHTPEHISFLVFDHGSGSKVPIAMVTGDFVFVGDLGRPDLLETAAGIQGTMEPGARVLFESVKKFEQLPEYLQIWPAHGAGSACGKSLGDIPLSTVGYELRNNPSILAASNEDDFVRYILTGQPEPPLYFARMKRDNKIGPKVPGSPPRPRRISAQELEQLAGRMDAVVVDTRPDRSAFMAHHLPGSLYAPLDKSFPMVTGSYIEENTPIYLIVEKEHLDAVVTSLFRIGLDEIIGYATPAALEGYLREGRNMGYIDEIGLDEARELLKKDNVRALDVRSHFEFEEGHIVNARNIAHTRLLPRKDELDQNLTYLVYCRTGNRSAMASAFLKRYGFDVKYVNDLISKHKELVGKTEAGSLEEMSA